MDPNHQSPAATQTANRQVEVTFTNTPPALAAGSVSPSSGDTKTPFIYKVTYTDLDGDVPTYIQAIVDGTHRFDLEPADGSADAIGTGEEYSAKDVLLGAGEHTWSFEASDGYDTAVLPVAGNNAGPSVVRANTAPTLYDQAVSPGAGTPGTEFTYSVTYKDLENDPPADGVRISVDGGPFTAMARDPAAPLLLRDGDQRNGERYRYSGSPAEGSHNYSFNASDPWLGADIGPFDGPVVSTVPFLKVSIASPSDGSTVRNGTAISFNCSAYSNVPVTDIAFMWRSDPSGALSTERNFTAVLPLGSHIVTVNVSSLGQGLFAEDSVLVKVVERPVVVPRYTVVGYYPEGNVTINETESATFSVSFTVMEGAASMEWTVDGASAGSYDILVLRTDHASAGTRLVRFVLSLDGSEVWNRTWTTAVVDVPAGILMPDQRWKVGGPFWTGDAIMIDIPARDEMGRELTAAWLIDGIPLTSTGTNLSFAAGDRPFGTPGTHAGSAVLTNPDGTSLKVDFSYLVRTNDTGEDPPVLPEDQDVPSAGFGPIRDNVLGFIILIFGAVSVAGGVFKMAAALMPERARGVLQKGQEEMVWEE
jgi:hypothetical protein